MPSWSCCFSKVSPPKAINVWIWGLNFQHMKWYVHLSQAVLFLGENLVTCLQGPELSLWDAVLDSRAHLWSCCYKVQVDRSLAGCRSLWWVPDQWQPVSKNKVSNTRGTAMRLSACLHPHKHTCACTWIYLCTGMHMNTHAHTHRYTHPTQSFTQLFSQICKRNNSFKVHSFLAISWCCY